MTSEKSTTLPGEDAILAAYEKLFTGEGRAVRRFKHSGLRYVQLTGGAILVEQNPDKHSMWAQLARDGHRIGWVIRDGEYLGRVMDGKLEMLRHKRRG
ncbi:MAG TPA: hypothetical protein VNO70_14285 [Blastocatellia bacterium]|nr:hypothetical protein [Blastocatellia bacterium]